MKYQEIIKKDDQALQNLVKEQREVVRKARFDTTGSDQKDVRRAKKTIARCLTALATRTDEHANKSS